MPSSGSPEDEKEHKHVEEEDLPPALCKQKKKANEITKKNAVLCCWNCVGNHGSREDAQKRKPVGQEDLHPGIIKHEKKKRPNQKSKKKKTETKEKKEKCHFSAAGIALGTGHCTAAVQKMRRSANR